jgi:hypothetical protein
MGATHIVLGGVFTVFSVTSGLQLQVGAKNHFTKKVERSRLVEE